MTTSFVTLCRRILLALAAAVIAFAWTPAFAITFTNNTSIGAANTNYDGADIVVSNCAVTVDGSHAFNSLLVAAGGVLTHSLSPNGTVSNLFYVTNQPQILYGTTPVTLPDSNIIAATVSVTDSTGTILYTNAQDYLLSSPDGVMTQLQRTTNSAIPDGGTVLVSYEGFGASQGTVPAGLHLSITNNVEVDAGGAINVNGAGYSAGPGAGTGTGSPQAGSGGAYGGNGGASSSTAVGGSPYGSYLQPTNPGSGGGTGASGAGGAGGGVMQITAGGSVIINGVVSANGANGTNNLAGGGSGGSIWITGSSFSGTGTITANGGAGTPSYGGGGGGGRISFQYSSTSFTGSMAAVGGVGFSAGTAGTVYTKLNGQNGLLVFDNAGQQSLTNTSVSIQNNAVNLLIQNSASVQPSGTLLVANLMVASNSFLLAMPLNTFTLSAGAITVQAGGGILANGAGSPSGTGSGPGHSFNDNLYRPCGGGGYGGNGAAGSSTNASGGAAYGQAYIPNGFGSGGGTLSPYSIGGNGGGAIQITCPGVVQVDGVLSANGGNGSGSGGGGGSGGTVTLSGGTLVGSGSITVGGGNGADSIGGGGGGGRIYVNPSANLFGGNISAYGGSGANWGGAGTVVIQVSGQNTQLIVDNGGHGGTNTPVQSSGAMDLVVRGGAICSSSSSVSFVNLYVNSNGWLTAFSTENDGAPINFTLTGNATIQAGGGIIADLGGYAPGQGTGEGRSGSTNLCSGAGHGGYGGNSSGNAVIGGAFYDSVTAPSIPGSGGGSVSPTSPGGYGGGVIRLSVTGTLEMDGVISANGGNGSGLAGGGGSGGSIWLSTGTFSGAGSVAANGGGGSGGLGGGGAGGMIYISCNNNSFAGTLTAYGGGGANRGGAGTTVIQLPGKNAQLIVDAGGNPGAFTPFPSSTSIDVTLRSGAVCYSGAFVSVGNVLLSSNSSLYFSNSMTCASLNVQAGASILADGLGTTFSTAQASSQSPYYACGGGANAGSGGNSLSNLASGAVNTEYYYEPEPGGAGASYSPYSVGGAGGAGISITATGLMQIDGLISANGSNGAGIGGGGGAGGGVSLSCGSFAGVGVIRANGGSGAYAIGGGGGGGWISITVPSTANQFNGTITAYGGGGANWGGAGVVSTQTSVSGTQLLILDNNGNTGPATPLNGTIATSVILRNAAVGFVGSSTLTLSNVLISSNCWLLVSNNPGSSATMNFTSATIQAGGGIISDSQGYAAGLGTGAGHAFAVSPNFPCGGAGHGGNGGNGYTNAAAGGTAYDNQQSPSISGSGGASFAPYSLGGSGGGAFSLTVSGLLQVDGVISANGGNGSGVGGGGGSGGSIKLTVGTLSGGGVIRANGGNGVGSIGGGGAGGCIALFPTANLFAGTISVGGGSGANWGGAGTLFMQTTGQNAQLILDNGGQPGAATQIQTLSSSTALILRNGAMGYQQSTPQTFASLLIGSNSWLMANTNTGLINLTLTGNATIQPGGGILADAAGPGGGSGSGAGHPGNSSPYFPSSGGGYGGYGANSGTNSVMGGIPYGSIIAPTIVGSGGGTELPNSIGGAGGGAIRLTVNGTLDVSGKISTAGGNGSALGGGGGSGGSIYLTVGTLAGNGAISANGGNGADSVGGGGGGGRISIGYNANSFVGLTTAYGGSGSAYGGAGTIYTLANSQSVGPVLVDNGGEPGADTLLSSSLGLPSLPFNLTVQNGAVACQQSGSLQLSNLTVAAGGVFTGLSVPATINLMVFRNIDIEPGGAISVDGQGYAQFEGSGAGQSSGGYGSGAGYGGPGGASTTIAGGVSYGSIFQPTDFGSGGGAGSGTFAGGSGGGGAIQLNVGGILTVDGRLSAGGQAGIQDNSGGGSGGSIWVNTSTLAGSGSIAANGGAGELYGGGGGAGGRIALYSHATAFLGNTSVTGGTGDFAGANGTIFTSNLPPLLVLSNSPSGVVSNSVSSVTLYFNDMPSQASLSANSISLTTPNGILSSGSLSFSMVNPTSYQVSFPTQTAVGNYLLNVSGGVTDFYGQPLAQAYNGTFSISLPVIQGTVTDTNGNPLAGVLLQPSGAMSTATTDTNGNYSLGFIPGSSFTVTPSSGALVFVPPSLSYTNVSNSIPNQNYTGVTTIAPTLSAGTSGANLALSWQAIPGVNYQVYCSTNLTNWVPWGGAFTSNGTVQVLVPMTNNSMFFSVQPSD